MGLAGTFRRGVAGRRNKTKITAPLVSLFRATPLSKTRADSTQCEHSEKNQIAGMHISDQVQRCPTLSRRTHDTGWTEAFVRRTAPLSRCNNLNVTESPGLGKPVKGAWEYAARKTGATASPIRETPRWPGGTNEPNAGKKCAHDHASTRNSSTRRQIYHSTTFPATKKKTNLHKKGRRANTLIFLIVTTAMWLSWTGRQGPVNHGGRWIPYRLSPMGHDASGHDRGPHAFSL